MKTVDHCVQKIFSVKCIKLPWLNDNHLRNIKEKHELHRALKNNTVSRSTYTSYGFSLNKTIFKQNVPAMNKDFHVAAMIQRKLGGKLLK